MWNFFKIVAIKNFASVSFLTSFRMGILGAAREWGGNKKAALPKFCHTYPTMMRLRIVIPYLKKIQKIYDSYDTPLEFCWHQHFFTTNLQIPTFVEINGEKLVREPFLLPPIMYSVNRIAALRSTTLLKKKLWHRCFPVSFVKGRFF